MSVQEVRGIHKSLPPLVYRVVENGLLDVGQKWYINIALCMLVRDKKNRSKYDCPLCTRHHAHGPNYVNDLMALQITHAARSSHISVINRHSRMKLAVGNNKSDGTA